MIIDADRLSKLERYRWLIGSVLPRPIAFVSTRSAAGVSNLAPFSFYNGVCSTPPVISLAIGWKKDGTPKDTLANIQQTGELVVNLVTEAMGPGMVACSNDWPAETSEFEQCGFSEAPCERVAAPRVSESPLAMECRLLQSLEVGDGPTTLVLAEILCWHIQDELLDAHGLPDATLLAPLGRLGGKSYAPLNDVIEIARPKG